MQRKTVFVRPLIVLRFCVVPCVAFISVLLMIFAVQIPTRADIATADMNLATALSHAIKPDTGIVLSVAADRVNLPPGADPVPLGSTVERIGNCFVRIVRSFGDVMAVAPSTMTVINSNPSNPNPFDGISSTDAITLLCAQLSDLQWRSIVSETGISKSDLTSESQKELFDQILSGGKELEIIPKDKYSNFGVGDIQDVTSQLSSCRLRLASRVEFRLPSAGPQGYYYSGLGTPESPGAQPHYTVVDRANFQTKSDTVYGIPVREDRPNEPKTGQLDFSSSTMQQMVSVRGINTVNDIVMRVGLATHTEIYADARLEKLPLIVLLPTNGATSVPAGDLLSALAYSVTGTFRQVGPAYVLTDDIVGVGERSQTWHMVEQYGDALLAQAVLEAGVGMFRRHKPRDIQSFDDPAASASAQDQSDPNDYQTIQNYVFPEFRPSFDQSLSHFTPSQQAAIRRIVDMNNQLISDHNAAGERFNLDRNIEMEAKIDLQLLLPKLNGPISLPVTVSERELFRVPKEVDAERQKKADEFYAKKFGTPNNPPVSPARVPLSTPKALADALARIPARAAIIRPRTLSEADLDIAAIKKLHFTEAWIDVFSDGKAHLPGVPQSDAAGAVKSRDILSEALLKTRGSGIKVVPMIELFTWGQTPPEDAVDRTITGQTSTQAAAEWRQISAMFKAANLVMSNEVLPGAILPNDRGTAVCPSAATVRNVLRAVMKGSLSHPGVSNVVWTATDPAGYDLPRQGETSSSLLLGYNRGLRLAFLRLNHVDPIDIFPAAWNMGRANTDVPFFKNGNPPRNSKAPPIDELWRVFRNAVGTNSLRDLWSSVRTENQAVTILIKQRRVGEGTYNSSGNLDRSTGWFGSWDTLSSPPPTLRSNGEEERGNSQPYVAIGDVGSQARMQSRTVYQRIPFQLFCELQKDPKALAEYTSGTYAKAVVLDFSDQPQSDKLIQQLAITGSVNVGD